MAVASPYAVFRAVDLGWPLAMPAIGEPLPAPAARVLTSASTSPSASSNTPRKRSSTGLRRRSAPQWNTLIQGELFPA